MKLILISRSLSRLSWSAALGVLAFIAPAATSATAPPFDEPPCYMRTQDGSIVDLQSLCTRSTPQQTPAAATTQQPQRMLPQQTTPTQVNVPRASATTGSHALGNPDSDDGRY